MKNKILALLLATVMIFSISCTTVAFAVEETASSETVLSGDPVSDIIDATIGDDLKDKQDEANAVIENGHIFGKMLQEFIEKIQQFFVQLLDKLVFFR